MCVNGSVVAPHLEAREIELTKGQVALVSAHRYEYLKQWLWAARWSEKGKAYYAVRSEKRPDGKWVTIYMHRQIMGLRPEDDAWTVDHVDPSKTLDNTDVNLRIASQGDQMHNLRRSAANTSGYKGVSRMKDGKYKAQIKVKYKSIYLGLFEKAEDAHAAYCKAAKELHGMYARSM